MLLFTVHYLLLLLLLLLLVLLIYPLLLLITTTITITTTFTTTITSSITITITITIITNRVLARSIIHGSYVIYPSFETASAPFFIGRLCCQSSAGKWKRSKPE